MQQNKTDLVKDPLPYSITEKQAEENSLHKVDNLSDFINLVDNWHTAACNNVTHVLNAEFQVPGLDGKSAAVDIAVLNENGERVMRALTDEEIPAFKGGIQYAMELFGNLPFHCVHTDADGKPTKADDPVCETKEDTSTDVSE